MKGSNIGTFNFTALLECIYEADQAAEVMYVATSQIIPEAIKDKQPVEGLIGLFFIYSAFETFETQALPICESVDKKSDWNNFNAHPKLTSHDGEIFLNGEDITKQLEDAGQSLKAGKYEEFGEKVGSATCKKEELFLF